MKFIKFEGKIFNLDNIASIYFKEEHEKSTYVVYFFTTDGETHSIAYHNFHNYLKGKEKLEKYISVETII